MSIPIWRSGCCDCSSSSTNPELRSSSPRLTSRLWASSPHAGSCCTRAACMSTTETTMPARGERGLEAPGTLAAVPVPRFATPLVPQATASRRALVAVVAIMTFLASLTTGAVMSVRSAASEWQSDVAREVTIQIRPAAGRAIEAAVAGAVAIARAAAGVAEVQPYSKEEAARLLEPWLGTGLQLDDLPVRPGIVVRIAPRAPPDLPEVR